MTATTQAPTLIEAISAPARLDRCVDRMLGDNPTLTDVSAVLYLLGTATDVDPIRMQALCAKAGEVLGLFSADVRYAPPAELNDLVKDAQQSCGNADRGCFEHVLPWSFDGTYCSPTCRNEDMAARGDS